MVSNTPHILVFSIKQPNVGVGWGTYTNWTSPTDEAGAVQVALMLFASTFCECVQQFYQQTQIERKQLFSRIK